MRDMDRKKPLDRRYAEALTAPTPAQRQIAEMAGAAHVSYDAARAWIKGRQRPSRSALALLAGHYGLPEDRLFSPGHFDTPKPRNHDHE